MNRVAVFGVKVYTRFCSHEKTERRAILAVSMKGRFNEARLSPLAVGAVALLVVAGIVTYALHQREPVYKGKSVAHWVGLACGPSPDSGKFRLELRKIGPRAIPPLIAKLHTRDTWLRKTWMIVQGKLPDPLSARLPEVEEASVVRARAVECLAMFGREAKPAVQELIQLLDRNEASAGSVLNALAAIGPDAGKALAALNRRMMTTTNTLEKVETAWAIWSIDRKTNQYVEFLTKAITQGTDDGGAGNAALGLWQLGPIAASAAPALVELLQNPTHGSGTRGNAAVALGALGVTDGAVMSALREGIQDADPHLSMACAKALWGLDQQASLLTVQAIVEAMVDRKKRQLGWGLGFAGFVGATGRKDLKRAVPALRVLLQVASPEVRQEAAKALQQIDPDAARKAGVE